MMTDYHVHIGQWNDVYFKAEDIFYALKKNGIGECWFSSTTSCLYSKTIVAGKSDAESLSHEELYLKIREEVKSALNYARTIDFKAHALYWVVPDIVKSGIGIERAMTECPYDGFKLHPRAQEWKLDDPVTVNFTEELFSYAEKQNLRILIHTGASGDDSPKRFEHFIKAHPNCLVQLAHLKDLDAQEYMLKKYPNVVVDSSFAGENEIEALVGDSIERKRILWGTDMPVTYWWYNVREKEKIPSVGKEALTEFYKRNHYSNESVGATYV
mgnify:CR=1 FL=1